MIGRRTLACSVSLVFTWAQPKEGNSCENAPESTGNPHLKALWKESCSSTSCEETQVSEISGGSRCITNLNMARTKLKTERPGGPMDHPAVVTSNMAQGTFSRSTAYSGVLPFGPYLAFTESIIALAITFWPDCDGWTPSRENWIPNTAVEASRVALVSVGQAGTVAPVPVLRAAKMTFGSR